MTDVTVIILLPVVATALIAIGLSVSAVRRSAVLAQNLAVLETKMAHMPDKSDLNSVVVMIERMNSEVIAARDAQRALRSSVDRIEGYLIGNNKEPERK